MKTAILLILAAAVVAQGQSALQEMVKTANEHGSYVRIWKKENGQWRIVMDVTNKH